MKLSDVYPDGRSMLVTDGILRARYRESFEQEDPARAGQGLRVDRGPVEHVAGVQPRPQDPRGRLVVELPALRPEPEHRRPARPARRETHRHEHAAPFAGAHVVPGAAGGRTKVESPFVSSPVFHPNQPPDFFPPWGWTFPRAWRIIRRISRSSPRQRGADTRAAGSGSAAGIGEGEAAGTIQFKGEVRQRPATTTARRHRLQRSCHQRRPTSRRSFRASPNTSRHLKAPEYKESQVRQHYIDPFWGLLGWDVQ